MIYEILGATVYKIVYLCNNGSKAYNVNKKIIIKTYIRVGREFRK